MKSKAFITPADRIVREPEVRELTQLSRTRRFELMKEGRFPRKIKISDRASGWKLSEISAWIESRPQA